MLGTYIEQLLNPIKCDDGPEHAMNVATSELLEMLFLNRYNDNEEYVLSAHDDLRSCFSRIDWVNLIQFRFIVEYSGIIYDTKKIGYIEDINGDLTDVLSMKIALFHYHKLNSLGSYSSIRLLKNEYKCQIIYLVG